MVDAGRVQPDASWKSAVCYFRKTFKTAVATRHQETSAQLRLTDKARRIEGGATAPRPTRGYTEDFEFFWKLYPRKEGKGAAFDSWLRLDMPKRRSVYIALQRQVDFLTARAAERGNLCPHASTWLNEGRFDDTPVIADGINPVLKKKIGEDDWEWQERINREVGSGNVTKAEATRAGWMERKPSPEEERNLRFLRRL